MFNELIINVLASAILLFFGYLVGKFRERKMHGGKNLNDYELLLLENDQDLYHWFSGAIKPPKHFEIIVKIISDTLR